MNLEVEVFLTSRTVRIDTNNIRVAEAYGRYSEEMSDENWDKLLEEIEPYVNEAVEYEITDVRLGRQMHKRPWLTREEGE